MKLRIIRITTDHGYIYKVYHRVFFLWFECKDGVCGEPFVPTFSRYQTAEMFGMHYASIRNQKAKFI